MTISFTGKNIGELKFFHLETDLHIKFGLAPLFDGEKLFFLLIFKIPGNKTQSFIRSLTKKLADIVFLKNKLFAFK